MYELSEGLVQLRNVLIQQSTDIFKIIGVIWAVFNLCMGGIKYMQGDREIIGRTIIQIFLGMILIFFAANFVYLLTEFLTSITDSVPTFGG